ncbi:hypothetical protein DFH07DRAFT_31244 [Mycena maculata]|uniref:Uncharacterized protein n=1 Tax=Mycena maculata TaxID=230809 RepID=A0AAD7K2F1_9AGAR|nr:hypothetical protein DFH07DRAFT_31244 [Mycena maculata]
MGCSNNIWGPVFEMHIVLILTAIVSRTTVDRARPPGLLILPSRASFSRHYAHLFRIFHAAFLFLSFFRLVVACIQMLSTHEKREGRDQSIPRRCTLRNSRVGRLVCRCRMILEDAGRETVLLVSFWHSRTAGSLRERSICHPAKGIHTSSAPAFPVSGTQLCPWHARSEDVKDAGRDSFFLYRGSRSRWPYYAIHPFRMAWMDNLDADACSGRRDDWIWMTAE